MVVAGVVSGPICGCVVQVVGIGPVAGFPMQDYLVVGFQFAGGFLRIGYGCLRKGIVGCRKKGCRIELRA